MKDKKRLEIYEACILSIMQNFDFKIVADTMQCLDWKWNSSVPSYDEIKEYVNNRLHSEVKKIIKDKLKKYITSSGGFEIRYHKTYITISFICEDWTGENDD